MATSISLLCAVPINQPTPLNCFSLLLFVPGMRVAGLAGVMVLITVLSNSMSSQGLIETA